MATDYETAREQYETYRYCYENGHQQFLERATACFDFWDGKQWDPAVKARLEREGRPALTFNVVESLVRSMKGIQRALSNDVRFTPVHDATDQSAQIMDAIWLHTANQNMLDFLETEIYEKGLIMSRAFYDVRMDYNNSLQGEIRIRGRRSQDVVLDPAVETYDTTEWPRVFTRRWVSYNDIRDAYGKDKAEAVGLNDMPGWYDFEDIITAQQMGSVPYYRGCHPGGEHGRGVRGHLLTDHQYYTTKRKDVFIDVNTNDWSEVPETWDRERIGKVLQSVPGLTIMKRDVRTIRWTVTCEDTVLHDSDSPYSYFTIVPYFPTFIDGVTKGAVESLIDPQQLYNKITSSELHIIATTANSGWKAKVGSVKNMTMEEFEEKSSKAGFVVELDEVANLEKIQPNQTPQGHDRLSFKADQIMRSLSGVSNQARGFAREDVAGEAILANQAAQDINFAGFLSNLHRTKQLLARNVLDCAQAHYTETRVLRINKGSAFRPQSEVITINQPSPEGGVLNDVTRGKYSTTLVPAPNRATLTEADFTLLLKLRTEVGVAIPDAMLIELSPASNKAAIIQALEGGPDSAERQRQAEAAAAEAQALEVEKTRATTAKELTAAELNRARAENFSIEAASDPDASYERVEMARIATETATAAQKQRADEQEAAARLALDERKQADTRRYQDQQIALRLAELEVDREERAADREVAKQESAAKRREKKPTKT